MDQIAIGIASAAFGIKRNQQRMIVRPGAAHRLDDQRVFRPVLDSR